MHLSFIIFPFFYLDHIDNLVALRKMDRLMEIANRETTYVRDVDVHIPNEVDELRDSKSTLSCDIYGHEMHIPGTAFLSNN